VLPFVVRRLAAALGILLVVSAVTFFLFFAVPGEPAAVTCGRTCTPERIADINHALGFDKPVLTQYADFMRGLVAGRDFVQAEEVVHCRVPCLGYSVRTGQPVTEVLLDRFPATLSLAAGAAVLFLLGGVGVGVLSALRQGGPLDKAGVAFALAGASLQIYFVGLLLQNIFVRDLGWLPRPGYTPLTENPGEWFAGLLLPWFTLAFVSTALYARLTRATMIEVLSEDYIRAARARGLSRRQIYVKHAGRATISPVVTVFGLDFAGLLGGAIITESVFPIHGLGELAVKSVATQDLPMIMGTVLVAAVAVLVANLIVDVVYALVDPRVRIT
jgi:peptide/nickel transport system permease protein